MEAVFTPYANAEAVTVSRGEKHKLSLVPAEVDKATKIIGIALSMESFDQLPSHIKNSPFVIRFFEDNKLALERLDTSGSIPFEWAEGDELIVTLQKALAMAINERVLVKGVRATGAVTNNSEPFI